MLNLAEYDQRRTSGPRSYEPKSLNAQHHEILRLTLLGKSQVDIAAELGCTPQTVNIAVNSGLGRDQLSLLHAEADVNAVEIAQKIRETAPVALAAIQSIIESPDVSAAVRLKASIDILDRAGHAPIKKVDVRKMSMELSADDLEGVKQLALQKAMEAGVIIDGSIIKGTS